MNKLFIVGTSAEYTGTDGSGNFCNQEFAENLNGNLSERVSQALSVWGLFEEDDDLQIIADGQKWPT